MQHEQKTDIETRYETSTVIGNNANVTKCT